MPQLKERIIRAHGGEQQWQDVVQIMASVSLGGVEFFSRFQFSPLRDVDVQLQLDCGRLTFSPYPVRGKRGVFTPQKVWVEDDAGQRIAERETATELRSLRHRVLWDQLDVLQYTGTLVWQGLQLPFLLLQPDVECEEQGCVEVGGERCQRLLVRYPASIPAVAPQQMLYADPTGLVRRADHSPTAYGSSWLKVAQCWDSHESFSGLVYATRRSLYPCLANGLLWKLAHLLWMELDDVSVVRSGARRSN